MTVLRNRSIASKIAASFAVVLALLAAVAGTAFWATTSMAGSTHRIADVAAVKAQAADTVGGLAAYIHESQTRFVLNRGASYQDHLGDVKAFQGALTSLARDSVTPADHARLAAIRQAFARVRRFDGILYADVQAGRNAPAEALVDGAANDAADALAAAADAYLTAADAEKTAAVANFDAARSLSSWLMIAITAAAAALAALLGYLLIRSIRRPLADMQRVAEAIAQGDLEQSIDVQGTDEIGTMAAAFARVIEYLRRLAGAAERVAAGDLTTTVEPASERDALGGRSRPSRRTCARWSARSTTRPRASRARRSRWPPTPKRPAAPSARSPVRSRTSRREPNVRCRWSTTRAARPSRRRRRRTRPARSRARASTPRTTPPRR